MTLVLSGVGLMGCFNPNINALDPDEGPVGTEVTITGAFFGEDRHDSTVRFARTEVPADGIRSWSSSEVVVEVPEGAQSGPVTMRVEGLTSNRDQHFTVQDASRETQPLRFGLSVVNRYVPGIEVFAREPGEELARFGEISLVQGDARIEVHGLAWSRKHSKVYTSVSRDGVRSLLAFAWAPDVTGATGGFMESTIENVGFEPAGMVLSPDEEYLWVSSTASASLIAVDTATDTVDEELSLDIPAYVSGFEPLNAAIVPSPEEENASGYRIVVVGHHLSEGKAEVLTFAPHAPDSDAIWIANAGLPGTRLNGSLSVVAGTQYAYVVGERNDAVTIALVDVFEGRVVHQFDLTAEDETTADFATWPADVSTPVTEAVSIAVRGDIGSLYVSTPPHGILKFNLPVTTTADYPRTLTAAVDVTASVEQLKELNRPLHLAPLLNAEGKSFAVLATQAGGREVTRIDDDLSVSTFTETMTSPTLLSVTLEAAAE